MLEEDSESLILCPICLENSTDVCAPCGFEKSRFHFKCIEKLKDVQGKGLDARTAINLFK